MNKKMQQLLNKQMNFEIESAYLYLSMASYFDCVNLHGFSKWMQAQHREEMCHAMKFYSFLFDRDGRAELTGLGKPAHEYSSPLHAFEYALKHEKTVTSSINELAAISVEEKDFVTHNFLQWFLNEQVEEESSIRTIVEQLRKIENSPQALLFIDGKLSERQ